MILFQSTAWHQNFEHLVQYSGQFSAYDSPCTGQKLCHGMSADRVLALCVLDETLSVQTGCITQHLLLHNGLVAWECREKTHDTHKMIPSLYSLLKVFYVSVLVIHMLASDHSCLATTFNKVKPVLSATWLMTYKTSFAKGLSQ